MSELNSYDQCLAKLAGRITRKLCNNTYLKIRDGEAIAVLLHSTDVVTYHKDGRIVLGTGGWQTVTTKERMNRFSPFRIWSEKGVWLLSIGTPWREPTQAPWTYRDGVTLCNGDLTGEGEDPKKTQKLRARVLKYARAYIKALIAGEVPEPSGGDCWFCAMVPQDGSRIYEGNHILSHIEESYFVPSIIVRAFETFGASQAMYWCLGTCWGKDCGGWSFGYTLGDHMSKQAVKMIAKHCYRELGLAS